MLKVIYTTERENAEKKARSKTSPSLDRLRTKSHLCWEAICKEKGLSDQLRAAGSLNARAAGAKTLSLRRHLALARLLSGVFPLPVMLSLARRRSAALLRRAAVPSRAASIYEAPSHNADTIVYVASTVVAVLGVSYAAVPLYRAFCQVKKRIQILHKDKQWDERARS